MAFSSCLSFIEDGDPLSETVFHISLSLEEWKEEDSEVVRSGQQMRRALFSEGFEDTLEQRLMNDKDGRTCHRVVQLCDIISKLLGSNENGIGNEDEEESEFEEEFGETENEEDTENDEEEFSESQDKNSEGNEADND
ncbi:hypothetical protein BLNAU_4996 [Blattamonas nauphoetae]|uniref:Uncharacterized protein n=1 Tax=Blattamonas nauphoetae TaxID=2049346 RepID=A0ABQ9Y8U7_9EUKA|nr:hypothetical protein BLNAU_4996 [Blattamonas nauphoetae]